MTSAAEALQRFFGGFGLPAYPEGCAPQRAKPPYITYQVLLPDWRETAPFHARVWYRSASYAGVNAKCDEIGAAIGEGLSLPTDSGALYIGKGRVFCQHMSTAGDPDLKCNYLSLTLQALTH